MPVLFIRQKAKRPKNGLTPCAFWWYAVVQCSVRSVVFCNITSSSCCFHLLLVNVLLYPCKASRARLISACPWIDRLSGPDSVLAGSSMLPGQQLPLSHLRELIVNSTVTVPKRKNVCQRERALPTSTCHCNTGLGCAVIEAAHGCSMGRPLDQRVISA